MDKLMDMLQSDNVDMVKLAGTMVLQRQDWMVENIPHIWRYRRKSDNFIPTQIHDLRITDGDMVLLFCYGGLFYCENKNILGSTTNNMICI
jgi:hypothetical protein